MTRVPLLSVLLAIAACGSDSVHLGGERRVEPDASSEDGDGGPDDGDGPWGPGHDDGRGDGCRGGDRPVCGSDGRGHYEWYPCLDALEDARGVKPVPPEFCEP